jgi:hypothetical protein
MQGMYAQLLLSTKMNMGSGANGNIRILSFATFLYEPGDEEDEDHIIDREVKKRGGEGG